MRLDPGLFDLEVLNAEIIGIHRHRNIMVENLENKYSM